MRRPPEIGPLHLLALFLVLLHFDGGQLGPQLEGVNEAIGRYLEDLLTATVKAQSGP